MYNIVQAEFFHVGDMRTQTLRQVLDEASERVTENLLLAESGIETTTGIKTVVRFFYEENRLTDVVRKVEHLHEALMAGLQSLSLSSNVLRRYYADWRLWILSRRKWALEQKATRIAVRMCVAALNTRSAFAVERMDRSFTVVAPEERHDTKERVRGGTRVWLFIFRPNDLLSDTNQTVAVLM